MNEEQNAEPDAQGQIQVKFFTKLKSYTIPPTPFSIQHNIANDELNLLINSILKQENLVKEDKQIEFDFLLNGQFITDTLQNHIASNNLLTETELEIEYIEKQSAPWPEKMMLQNDWVSSIAVKDNQILSGSYDNFVYIWDIHGNCLHSINEHTAAVKAVQWVQKEKNKAIFLSSSLDQTIKICQWSPNQKRSHCLYVCKGHSKSVDCLAVHPTSRKFCSGSWDKSLKLWSSDVNASENDGEQEIIKKKTKSEHADKYNITRTPLMTLTGHNEAITSVLWSNDSELISCSWDHTIRVWDLESGVNQHTLTGGKAFNCISYSPHSKLIASASADRHVRLWDHRIKDGVVCQKTLTSHNGWLSAVCWSPNNQFTLASGSYDQTVNIWDTRSPNRGLHTLRGHNNKVTCVNWEIEQLVVSGGTDNQLIIHRVSGEHEDDGCST